MPEKLRYFDRHSISCTQPSGSCASSLCIQRLHKCPHRCCGTYFSVRLTRNRFTVTRQKAGFPRRYPAILCNLRTNARLHSLLHASDPITSPVMKMEQVMVCGPPRGHCRHVYSPMCNTLRYVSKASPSRKNGRGRSCVDTRSAIQLTAHQYRVFLNVAAVNDTLEFRRASPSADTSS